MNSSVRLFAFVALVSFVLNYIWEMAQMPLFRQGDGQRFEQNLRFSLQHCFIPTLGDVLVAATTFVIGWVVYGQAHWIQALTWREVLLVSIPLVLLALVVELTNVYVLHHWSYSELMPIVPVVEVGLVPTVQLALLTLVSFWIVGRAAAS